MNYIERGLRETFFDLRDTHPITAVVGARQAGKTTFVKQQMPSQNASYILFDDPDARALFDDDVKKFDLQYLQGTDVAVLDEVQQGSDAGRKLKYLADIGRTLWITSSSEILLKKDILSHLVGRVGICRLYPFHVHEFRRANELRVTPPDVRRRGTWEHAVYGGYPAVVTTDGVDRKKQILNNLYETMVLKDVARTFSIENVDGLMALTRHLSFHTGSTVTYQTICDDLDLSFQTLKKYLTALEQSYLIQRIKPFTKNPRKELKKRPKVFFIDTGIRNAIRRAFPEEVDGPLFENYVFTELIKAGHTVRYWRKKSSVEVDFIVSEIPVEVKRTSSSVPSGIRSFIRSYQPDRALVVRYRGEPDKRTFEGTPVHFTDAWNMFEHLPAPDEEGTGGAPE